MKNKFGKFFKNKTFIIILIAGLLLIAVLVLFLFSNNKVNNNNISINVENNILNEKGKVRSETIDNFEVPILMYHYIREVDKSEDSVGANLSVTPAKFDEQIKWLKDNGYHSVDFEYILNPYNLDKKPIIITFDDGYRDAYTNAFPILKKYEFTGVFYLITDSVGYPYYITWDMAKEMQKSGMQFGSHTLSHPDLRNVSDADLDSQLRYSKDKIEKELNTKVSEFCFPAGKYDERTINKLTETGYKTAVTTKMGIADQNSDKLKLPRRRVLNDSDISKLVVSPQDEL